MRKCTIIVICFGASFFAGEVLAQRTLSAIHWRRCHPAGHQCPTYESGRVFFVGFRHQGNGSTPSRDEGESWQRLTVDGGSALDFRDVEGFDGDNAFLMSSGDGSASAIYKTTNGGHSWELQYTDKRAGFFLDSLACRSATECFALSDPVEGKFLIVYTSDGQRWKELPRDKMPVALPTEGGFAASGTSIALCGKQDIYFGTGGPAARIFHSGDYGRSWTATETPLASGNAFSGVFSVACRGTSIVAVGGNYRETASRSKVAIYSKDAGATWHLAEQQPSGYRSAVAFLEGGTFLAVGPNGTDISRDAGVHWESTGTMELNAVSIAGGQVWAVGPHGNFARFSPGKVNH